jgi:DNA-binding Xre family transcriptional regulator
MGHALLKTPGGEELVVLPLAEYQRLVEDAEMLADIAAYDAVKKDSDEGLAQFLPAALVDRMIAGESPVRVWREHRGLTAAELAAAAGLSAAYVSQIETGSRAGTTKTLQALAEALSVELDDIA